jgi:nucleoside-diphosphate-sugar epimerase
VKGRVLVAGGAGFLGSHLCARLHAEGIAVVCLDDFSRGSPANVASLERRDGFTLVDWDITRPQLRYGAFDTVFHLARGQPQSEGPGDPDVDLRGTLNALEIARRAGALFILVSSARRGPGEDPAAEPLALAFVRDHGMSLRIARIHEAYGPRQTVAPHRTVATLAARAVAGESLEIPGDGTTTLRPCYVTDVVQGLLALLGEDLEGPVDLASEQRVSLLELASQVLRVAESESPIALGGRPLDGTDPVGWEMGPSARLTSWEPRVALEEGLASTVAWARWHVAGQQPALTGRRVGWARPAARPRRTRAPHRGPALRSLPAVSLLVYARNDEGRVDDLLERCLSVEYPPGRLETVVVNDGSTDSTWRKILDVKARHPELHAIDLASGVGVHDAFVVGAARAAGEVVSFVHLFPPPAWLPLTELTLPFADESVDAVAGPETLTEGGMGARRYAVFRAGGRGPFRVTVEVAWVAYRRATVLAATGWLLRPIAAWPGLRAPTDQPAAAAYRNMPLLVPAAGDAKAVRVSPLGALPPAKHAWLRDERARCTRHAPPPRVDLDRPWRRRAVVALVIGPLMALPFMGRSGIHAERGRIQVVQAGLLAPIEDAVSHAAPTLQGETPIPPEGGQRLPAPRVAPASEYTAEVTGQPPASGSPKLGGAPGNGGPGTEGIGTGTGGSGGGGSGGGSGGGGSGGGSGSGGSGGGSGSGGTAGGTGTAGGGGTGGGSDGGSSGAESGGTGRGSGGGTGGGSGGSDGGPGHGGQGEGQGSGGGQGSGEGGSGGPGNPGNGNGSTNDHGGGDGEGRGNGGGGR